MHTFRQVSLLGYFIIAFFLALIILEHPRQVQNEEMSNLPDIFVVKLEQTLPDCCVHNGAVHSAEIYSLALNAGT